MRCPDCAGQLMDVTLTGIDKSFRCFNCGGMWLIAKTINGLPVEDMSHQWKKVEVDSERLKLGDNKCPQDGTDLDYYQGELIPNDLKVRQCKTCHWWWFPEDSIFRYKPIQEERRRKRTIARPLIPMMMAALVPLLSLVLLITGGVVGVRLLRNNQQVQVAASQNLQEVSGVRFDQGEAVITFVYEGSIRSGVEVYLADESIWVPVTVSVIGENRYQIAFKSLVVDEGIKIKVNGEEAMVPFRDVSP